MEYQVPPADLSALRAWKAPDRVVSQPRPIGERLSLPDDRRPRRAWGRLALALVAVLAWLALRS